MNRDTAEEFGYRIMQKVKKQKLSFMILSPFLLVVFLFAGQQTQASEDDFAKRAQCFQIGKIYYEKTVTGLGNESLIYKISYEVAYNKKQNTCFFFAETTFRTDKNNQVNAYIRDLFRNKNIYFMSYGSDGTILQSGSSFKTEQEFTDKYKELIMDDLTK